MFAKITQNVITDMRIAALTDFNSTSIKVGLAT